jgi:hypothetical protein
MSTEKIAAGVCMDFLATVRREAGNAARLLPNAPAGTFTDSNGFRFYAAQRMDAHGQEYVRWELLQKDGTDSGLWFGSWAPTPERTRDIPLPLPPIYPPPGR